MWPPSLLPLLGHMLMDGQSPEGRSAVNRCRMLEVSV